MRLFAERDHHLQEYGGTWDRSWRIGLRLGPWMASIRFRISRIREKPSPSQPTRPASSGKLRNPQWGVAPSLFIPGTVSVAPRRGTAATDPDARRDTPADSTRPSGGTSSATVENWRGSAQGRGASR